MMLKARFLSVFLFLFVLFTAVAQVSVEWTNQLFAGKTSGGQNVLVFIYPEYINFVYGQGKSYQKVKVLEDFGPNSLLSDIFIVGNTFCFRKNRTIYIYDLAKVLQSSSNNKDINNSLIESISGVDSVYVYSDTIYYIKGERIYRYNKDEKNKVLDGIQIPNPNLSYLAYNPVSGKYTSDYNIEKAKVNQLVSNYNNIVNETTRVAGISSESNASRQTPDGLYNLVKGSLSSVYRVDGANAETFSRFFYLATLAGSTDADSTVSVLNKQTTAPVQAIRDYYAAIREHTQLSSQDELKKLNQEVQDKHDRAVTTATNEYNAKKISAESAYTSGETNEKSRMNSRWGSNFQLKYTDLTGKESTLNGYGLVPAINENAENANVTKIADIDNFLTRSFPEQKKDSNEYIRYQYAKKVFDYLEADRKAKEPGYEALFTLRNQNARDIFGMQIALGKKALNDAALAGVSGRTATAASWADFKTEYTNHTKALTELLKTKERDIGLAESSRNDAVNTAARTRTTELAAVQTKLNREIANAVQKRNDNYNRIAPYLLNRFISEELYKPIMEIKGRSTIPPNQYNSKLADFCVITDSVKSIQGFTIPVSINTRDFEAPKNDSGELFRFCLSKPQSYTVISVVSNTVYVLSSEKEIYAYDLSKVNLLVGQPISRTLNEKVFYLLKSDINQYMVTRNGGLYRLGISNNAFSQPARIADVGGQDTVVVTTVNRSDETYVLSRDGFVNGRQTGPLRLSTGAGSYVTLSVQNKQFIVQE